MFEIWNQGTLDVADEIFTADFTRYDPGNPDFSGTVGPEGYKQLVSTYRVAFPDTYWTVDDMVAEGDLVTARWTSVGTNTGELMGMPATDLPVTVTGLTTVRIVEGKIAVEWDDWDSMGLMEQLGFAEATREGYAWSDPSELTGDPGDPEANKAVVMRYVEAWNQRNLDMVDEVMIADVIHHDPVMYPGDSILEKHKQTLSMYFSAFPDIHIDVEIAFAEGDKVAMHGTAAGTHQDELMGVPATGRQVAWTWTTVSRIADGKIVEIWWQYDVMGLMTQLTMSQEEINKAIARRDFEEGINQGKLEIYDEIVADDFVLHTASGDINGVESLKAYLTMYITAFPDFHFTIEDIFAEDDMVAIRWGCTGTHQGELMGIPPTGVSVVGTGISIQQYSGGKIKESWLFSDDLGMMQQLGAVTPGRPSPENYMWGAPSEVTGDPGDPEANKALVMRYPEEVWNQQNLDVLREICSEDLIVHNPANSPHSYMDIETEELTIKAYLAALPDFHVTVEDIVAEGDKVVCRWTATGAHLGELSGIPPTGRHLTFTGATIFRIADGKIVELWWSWDTMGLMQQLTATQEEINKAVATRSIEEVWNQGNLDAVDEIYAADYVNHDPSGDYVGPEARKQFVAMYRAAFSGLTFTIDDQIAVEDMVINLWSSTSTHTSEIMGIPATGVTGTITGIGISRFVDGKIVEAWDEWDMLGMLQHLGVAPARMAPASYTWGAPSEVTGDPGDPETNTAIVNRVVDEFWNGKNLDVLDETHSADSIAHNPAIADPADYETYKQVALAYITGLPDLHVTTDDLIAKDDKVIIRWTVTGTHQGEIMGIPASGKQVTYTGITIYRLADGMVVETWWAMDTWGLMQQIMPEEPTEDYSHVFFMSLSPGLNMISLPLKPIVPFTARTLAEHISANVVIGYDDEISKFVAFIPDAPDDGFDIEGGKGYIVNVPDGGTVAFVGAAWTNTPPVSAAPPAQTSNNWALVVGGSVLDGEEMSKKDGVYTVKVRNLTTGAVTETEVHTSGYFAAAYADMNRKSVVNVGDKVEVVVTDSVGKVASGPFVHEITPEIIRNAVVKVQMRLGHIIPEKPALLQNYPNPFNPETWIPYHLSDGANVSIRIYNSVGQLVRTLDLGHKDAGVYVSRSKAAYWDGKNAAGEEVSSGIYFYSITANGFSSIKKMIVKK
jgi:steroid delta-isomerase-like uncharacterized protein